MTTHLRRGDVDFYVIQDELQGEE